MTEFGFDRRNGELLVGAAAIELRQEEAGPEIIDVPTLLKTPDFPFKHGDFSPSDTAWNADACIELGRWTLSMLTETEDMPPALNKEHIRRLRVMGIGPGLREVTINNGFSSFTDYKQQVGAAMIDVRGVYDKWGVPHILHYVEKTWGHKRITQHEVDAMAARGRGPSSYVLGKIFGTIGALNNMRGFYTVAEWDLPEYNLWGAKVIAANGGQPQVLTSTLIDILSRRDQGPSYNQILKLYGGKLANFREAAGSAYQQLIEGQQIARHQIVESLVGFQNGGMSTNGGHELFASNQGLLRYLRTLRVRTSATELASVAARLGVLNILWPSDNYHQMLRVTDEELAKKRADNAVTRRRYPSSYVKRSQVQ